MAARPPHSTPSQADPRPSTPLSGVFRRMANEAAAPQAASPPPPVAPPRPVPPPPAIIAPPAPPSPQLLGFAEPVTEVPPIQDFLPCEEEAAPREIARLEALPPAPEPELEWEPELAAEIEPEATLEPAPAPEDEAEPAPPRASVRARARELPAAPAVSTPMPAERPQNLVGRLGRRLGDVPAAPAAAPAPKVRHLHESRPNPPPAEPVIDRGSRPISPPPGTDRGSRPPSPQPVMERADRLVSSQPVTDRSGRPSLPRNRRAYRRARMPAEIEIGDVPCTLIDISIGGFAATGVPQIEPNALVPVTIRLVIDGIEVGTQLAARIVYVTQGRSAGRFIDLNPSQMAFLRYIVTWRGESVGAVGTTTLLDAIAGHGDRGFTPGSGERPDPEAKSRWWAGLIGKKINPPR